MILLSFLTLAASLVSSQETQFTTQAGQARVMQEIQVRGHIEHARIMPDRLLMSAKLDSGARTASVDAEIISIEERESKSDNSTSEVTYRLTSKGGKTVTYTAPIVRWASIRRRGGGFIRRPVVMMELCLAGTRVAGEVNLADRDGFNYPLLIGRNLLTEAAIAIDSRQSFMSRRACPKDD